MAGSSLHRSEPRTTIAVIAATTKAVSTIAVSAIAVSALVLGGCHVSIGIGDDDRFLGSAEAPVAAAAALDTIVSFAGPGLGLGDDPARLPAGEVPRRALVPGTVDWLERAAAQRGSAIAAPGGRFSSESTLACDFGTMRVRSGFANQVAFAAGDTLTLDSSGCRLGSVRFSGELDVRVLDATGFPGISGAWNARLSLEYRGWRVETVPAPVQSRSFEGSASLEVRRLAVLQAEVLFDSAALTMASVVDGAARTVRAVEALSVRLADSNPADLLQIDARVRDANLVGHGIGTLQAASVGSLALADSPPSLPVGTVRVEIADLRSALFVDASDSAQIRLSIDRSVDGSIDSSQVTTLQALRSRL